MDSSRAPCHEGGTRQMACCHAGAVLHHGGLVVVLCLQVRVGGMVKADPRGHRQGNRLPVQAAQGDQAAPEIADEGRQHRRRQER